MQLETNFRENICLNFGGLFTVEFSKPSFKTNLASDFSSESESFSDSNVVKGRREENKILFSVF